MAKAKKLKSGNWRCLTFIGYDKTGKRQYKSFTAPTKREAELLALEYVNEIEQRRLDEQNPTLYEAFNGYIESRDENISPTTLKDYRECQEMYFQDLMQEKISSITRQMLQTSLNRQCALKSPRYNRKLSPKTIKNRFSLLLTVLRYYDFEFSARKFKLPQTTKPKYNTPDENALKRIIEVSYDTPMELPILFGMWLSLRRGEIAGLRWEDIDYDTNIMSVERTKVFVKGTQYVKTTKNTSSERVVLLPAYIIDRLKHYQKNAESEYIITLTPSAITHRFPRMLERNGIEHYTFHSLRHAFVSIGTLLGVSDAYLMKIGGWSSDHVMKGKYLQTFTAAERNAAEQMNSFFVKLAPNMQHKMQHNTRQAL